MGQVSFLRLKITINTIVLVVVFVAFSWAKSINQSEQLKGKQMDNKNILVGQEKFDFKIKLLKNSFKVNESIVIECSLENLTNQIFFTVPYATAFDAYVSYYDGEYMKMQEGWTLINERPDEVKLSPNKIYKFQRVFSEGIFILPKKQGRYRLFLEYANFCKRKNLEDKLEYKIRSNTVEFIIDK